MTERTYRTAECRPRTDGIPGSAVRLPQLAGGVSLTLLGGADRLRRRSGWPTNCFPGRDELAGSAVSGDFVSRHGVKSPPLCWCGSVIPSCCAAASRSCRWRRSQLAIGDPLDSPRSKPEMTTPLARDGVDGRVQGRTGFVVVEVPRANSIMRSDANHESVAGAAGAFHRRPRGRCSCDCDLASRELLG